MRWQSITLSAENPETQIAFYRDAFGMSVIRDGLHFGRQDARLVWKGGARGSYETHPDSFYWKIGVTVDDLSNALNHLQSLGVQTSEPRQFRDIGYLAHVVDPAGFPVELLQRRFEGRHQAAPMGHAIGAQGCLSHITLRVCDIDCARRYCEDQLGLRLMSIQPVPPRGFTLYFYAWSQEALPHPDLTDVKNREWLWSRPYTLLELQHLEGKGALPGLSPPDAPGLVSLATTKAEIDVNTLANMR